MEETMAKFRFEEGEDVEVLPRDLIYQSFDINKPEFSYMSPYLIDGYAGRTARVLCVETHRDRNGMITTMAQLDFYNDEGECSEEIWWFPEKWLLPCSDDDEKIEELKEEKIDWEVLLT